MAIGIVSVSAREQGYATLPVLLLVLALVALAVTAWSTVWYTHGHRSDDSSRNRRTKG